MKKFWTEFLKRGSLFAWGGPAILCIVWACLKGAGVVETLDVNTVILSVLSSIVMAFIAAGITVVYQMEQLPTIMAALIHLVVLYIDYLIVYILNGWLLIDAIWIFTLCFISGFALVWAIIYLSIRKSVKKLNSQFLK